MNIIKPITNAAVKAMQPGDIIRDVALKGFGVRRRKATATFFIKTRIHRQQRWITIGSAPAWTADRARQRATEILRNVDTFAETNPPPSQANDNPVTFKEAFDLFAAAHSPHIKANTLAEYTRLTKRRITPYFKNTPLKDIKRADCTNLHRSLVMVPSAANHCLSVISLVYNWAIIENIIPDALNPTKGVRKYKQISRAQFLSRDDLPKLAAAMHESLRRGEVTRIQIASILLLLFTGARRNEIFTLKRSYVDKNRMIAHLPDSKTGKKVIHLGPHAMAVLDALPQIEGNPYYLAGRLPGRCITEIKKPWDKIRKRAGLTDFRLHDFRHSFASFAADAGASARTVGALLGHASIETTKLYIHIFNQQAQNTASQTGEAINAILSGAMLIPQTSTPPSASQPTGSDQPCHTSQGSSSPDPYE